MSIGMRDQDAQRIANCMAAPLAQFNGTSIRVDTGINHGVAIAGRETSQQFHAEPGLTVIACGMPRFRDTHLQAEAEQHGAAAVLARCWFAKGSGLCAMVFGEFSLCIIDHRNDAVLLATDRMASRPVVFQRLGKGLLFGTSSACLVRHPDAGSDIDPQALFNYVYFHMVPGPDSIYRNQQRLQPGEFALWRKGELQIQKYWKMQFEETRRVNFAELKEEFIGVLRSSVKQAATSRTGAFLSGGTDSSTIAGLLSNLGQGPAKTYSIGFDAQGYDEMEYARIAARHYGTDHHEYYVTPDDVVDAVPRIAAVFDQPFGNASAVPAYYCARLAHADGLDRMLGGDGGDELFGGNERYAKQHIFSLYQRIPVPLRAAFVEPIAFKVPGGQRIPLLRKARSYIEQATIPMPARLETYNLLERYGAESVFAPDFLGTVDTGFPMDCLNDAYRQCNAHTLINRMLALDLKITLADNDLPKVVKACELAGMQVAFPFLNDDVVDFSARLAPDLKLKGTKLRYFFKEALRGVLPDEIITKKKHGFGLPFGVWLQQHPRMQAMARDSIHDLKARRIINPVFIDQLLNQHLKEHAGYHGTMVWVLMMLEQWFKSHQATA
ncbi:asparagine synthase [Noviherbaspirillum sp. 17J57-3]|uniref:asparagine synthase (glutamine-hydrolyzing) n=2 Tax=Noviherbaspirillum galbum TaxID=2709383 RepID=A0A6B3SUI0_9BURK|nr:asparagine synthase [Noviherbaspirillum galbum]